jgi:hypothetical protein
VIKRVLGLLGLSRISPATIPVFIVTGGTCLFALRQTPVQPGTPLEWVALYVAVILLAIALVAWGVLYALALVVRWTGFALEFRRRIGFQWPVYIRPEDDNTAIAPSQTPSAATAVGRVPVRPTSPPILQPSPFAKEFEIERKRQAEAFNRPESGMPQRVAESHEEGDVEARLQLEESLGATNVVVLNDGPPGEFRAEVRSVTSPNFRAKAEQTDWPWDIGWGPPSSGRTPKQAIKTANRGVFTLVRSDERGAQSQLKNLGGYAFVFYGPLTKVHGIHGRLGTSDYKELQAEELEITFRLYRIGPPDVYTERKVCLKFLGTSKFCDPQPE